MKLILIILLLVLFMIPPTENYNIWDIFGSVNRMVYPKKDAGLDPTWSREIKVGGYIVGYQKGFNIPGRGNVQYDYKVDPIMTYYMSEPVFKREGHKFGTINTSVPTHFRIPKTRTTSVPMDRPNMKTIINRTPVTHDLMHTLRNDGYTGTYADGPQKARQWMLNKYNIQ